MDSSEIAGWSVMGTGTIATEHMVAAIRSSGHKPQWVVSSNREYAKFFSEDMSIPNASTDARRALRDPLVNFVYVSASRNRRRHYIATAAAAKKHILCDWPISDNSRVADLLVAECGQAGVTLALNQPSRASTIHQTMRRLLLEGEIGLLQSLLIIRGAPFQPLPNRRSDEAETRGDILLDVSLEDVDLARFLTGLEPVEVSSLPSVATGDARQQMAYAIRMTGDVIFQAYESFSTAEIESVVMLAGDHGTLIAHGTLNNKGLGTLVRRTGTRSELIPVRERDPHHIMIEGFLDSIRRPSAWLCLGEDNVVALKAVEAIADAKKRRRTVSF